MYVQDGYIHADADNAHTRLARKTGVAHELAWSVAARPMMILTSSSPVAAGTTRASAFVGGSSAGTHVHIAEFGCVVCGCSPFYFTPPFLQGTVPSLF